MPVGNFVSNWTVGVTVDMPLFTGGRIGAKVADAQAALRQSELRLAQVRELASLDTPDALRSFEAARAAFQASSGTVAAAIEAYRIAEIRYREGLSTQLELSDSQLLLQQARVNRALAERDVKLAQLRVRMLPDLPLGTTTPPIRAPQPLTPPRQSPMVPAETPLLPGVTRAGMVQSPAAAAGTPIRIGGDP